MKKMRLMTRGFRFLIAFCGICFLSGCGATGRDGWFRNRAEDYAFTRRCPCIKVPQELTPEPFSERYEIP